MTEWKKLQSLFFKEVSNLTESVIEKYPKEIAEAHWNHLFNFKGPTAIKRNLRRDEIYVTRIFRSFTEIVFSAQTLDDISVYINSFPYRNKSITKSRHLRYHIENYFNEIYILRERMKTFFTLIERSFKNTPTYSEVLKKTRQLSSLIKKSFDGIVLTRGSHIHQLRYENDDLSRLDSLEILVMNSKDTRLTNFLSPFYEHTYFKTRSKWKETFKKNREIIEMLFEKISPVILDILFDKQTKNMKIPYNLCAT